MIVRPRYWYIMGFLYILLILCPFTPPDCGHIWYDDNNLYNLYRDGSTYNMDIGDSSRGSRQYVFMASAFSTKYLFHRPLSCSKYKQQCDNSLNRIAEVQNKFSFEKLSILSLLFIVKLIAKPKFKMFYN